MDRPYELEILSDERVGEGGFLSLRRLHLRNRRPDGTRSDPYVCDYVERDKGLDAVVLALYRRRPDGAGGDEQIEVLLRRGLRPPLVYGRPDGECPIPEGKDRFLFTEVVAGIIERGEVGEEAVRARAAAEAWEEAGVELAPERIELLGSAFPSPGLIAEKFWFAAAEVPFPVGEGAEAEPEPPPGDGSPMEEGAVVSWVSLDQALSLCRLGVIEDAKTELLLRRLADRFEDD